MRPEFAIKKELVRDGFTILFIDLAKATYRGLQLHTLDGFARRKFENLLIITRPKERLKIIYN